MEILLGLTGKQIGAIRHCSAHRTIGKGVTIFEEGDPAYGLFVIISGQVEIFKTTDRGETRLNILGPNTVFGEMGILGEGAKRTAGARALEESLVFEIQNNPIEMFRELGEFHGGVVMLKNLVCILGNWLRQKDKPDAVRVTGETVFKAVQGYETSGGRDATEAVRERLPAKGIFSKLPKERKLAKGLCLCRQGDKPDGFYFVHSGLLEIISEDGGEHRSLDFIGAPTVVGELGFFSGKPRSVTLRAAEDLVYTPFSGDDFNKLEKKDPEGALDLLFAAAQLIVHLIAQREGSR